MSVCYAKDFTDLSKSHWAYSVIQDMTKEKVLNGYPDGSFKPNGKVTRAEFATALSRMLYWLEDWVDKYYSTHLNKLYNEWIISSTDPKIKELRWYVMLMLMRSSR